LEDTAAPANSTEDTLRARAAYAELPDLRLDKVLEIRRRMAAGTFDPSAEELADAILASASNSLLCR
jgi:anti-sigma28 factor (negative regulator of flagellin synthesis)